jgi:hypothetical protein
MAVILFRTLTSYIYKRADEHEQSRVAQLDNGSNFSRNLSPRTSYIKQHVGWQAGQQAKRAGRLKQSWVDQLVLCHGNIKNLLQKLTVYYIKNLIKLK